MSTSAIVASGLHVSQDTLITIVLVVAIFIGVSWLIGRWRR